MNNAAKSGVVSQSNFLPWRGYFAGLREVDNIIFYDTEQYTRRDWRSRNRIANGMDWEWLSLPVQSKGHFLSPINTIKLVETNALVKLIHKVKDRYKEYSSTKGFDFVVELLSEATKFVYLSEINQFTTKKICNYLKIDINFFEPKVTLQSLDKNSKLINVCNEFKIQHYFSGPSSKNYLDEVSFNNAGIKVSYFNFDLLEPTTDLVEFSIIHHIIREDFDKLLALTTFSHSLESRRDNKNRD